MKDMKDAREGFERFIGFVAVMVAFVAAGYGCLWFINQNTQRMLGAGAFIAFTAVVVTGWRWFKDRVLSSRKKSMV